MLANGKIWYVDEFLEPPEKYLSGVDPEIDNFGYISVLEMWLHFKDFMKIGDENSFNKAQVAFKNKLKELV
ncbi:hypothetical protein [Psychromonas sp. MME2]|uniref:hypothetical protein n=1 Tax=unclassified Psychromonas TaxID=2614957 RepID=UPI00339C95D4